MIIYLLIFRQINAASIVRLCEELNEKKHQTEEWSAREEENDSKSDAHNQQFVGNAIK